MAINVFHDDGRQNDALEIPIFVANSLSDRDDGSPGTPAEQWGANPKSLTCGMGDEIVPVGVVNLGHCTGNSGRQQIAVKIDQQSKSNLVETRDQRPNDLGYRLGARNVCR